MMKEPQMPSAEEMKKAIQERQIRDGKENEQYTLHEITDDGEYVSFRFEGKNNDELNVHVDKVAKKASYQKFYPATKTTPARFDSKDEPAWLVGGISHLDYDEQDEPRSSGGGMYISTNEEQRQIELADNFDFPSHRMEIIDAIEDAIKKAKQE
jgi:hypothetical protein